MKSELETFTFRRKTFFSIANDTFEYLKDVIPKDEMLTRLKQRGADIFTFIDRRWCCPIRNPDRFWLKSEDNIALLEISTYEDWLKLIGKKTRNMIRKAEKAGIVTRIDEPTEKLAEGIWKIYNETPIRQDRAFPHYGITLEAVRKIVAGSQKSTFVCAYLENKLVGFAQLLHGDRIAIISQILSMQEHWDKAVNNALVAHTARFCAEERIRWVMYGRMGNHPSLDSFKLNNGCVCYPLTRYYVVLTRKGNFATKLGLHREMRDRVPQPAKEVLFPIYNWISRTKMKIRLMRRAQMPR